jgi:hypothetical protein
MDVVTLDHDGGGADLADKDVGLVLHVKVLIIVDN